MNFEPQKFFIGLMDFFTILLPGALLTYLFMDRVGPIVFGSDKYKDLISQTGIVQGGVVFVFCAYVLGHFVFLLGSWLLDEHLYHPIRTATYNEQIKRLADGKKLPWRSTKLLARWFIDKKTELALRKAESIMDYYLDPLGASPTINAFQWCKAQLILEHPEAMATVQRFEADSKFFRSFFVVLCIIICFGWYVKPPVISALCVPLLVLAFWRYVDQRIKAVNQSFWYVITMEGQSKAGFREASSVKKGGATHAGGIVFREARNCVEFLLVQAKKNPQDWVLPKGHIEPGERIKDTAVREVHEETGVWARIRGDLKIVSFKANGKHVKFHAYLMEAIEVGEPDEKRDTRWLPLDDAIDMASHDEIRELLNEAEIKRIELLKNRRS